MSIVDGAVTGTHTYSVAGTYAVTVTADDGVRSAGAQLEIAVVDPEPEYTPEIQVTPTAAPGDTVTITGTGFAPKENVSIRIDDETPVQTSADESGQLDADLMVPVDVIDGSHPVIALGEVSQVEARASVLVAADPQAPRKTSVALAAGSDDPVAGESIPW